MHPTRKELMTAAKSGQTDFSDHLAHCIDCRELLELFRAFPVAGEIPLQDAPAGWIAKANQIADLADPFGILKGVIAKLSFDSWTVPAAVGVRSQTVEQDRRLRFEVGPLHLDMRAEQGQTSWEFTAQITSAQSFDLEIVLIADRTEVRPNSLGFYQWTSPKPPKQLRLTAGDLQFDLPEMTWNQKRQS